MEYYISTHAEYALIHPHIHLQQGIGEEGIHMQRRMYAVDEGINTLTAHHLVHQLVDG